MNKTTALIKNTNICDLKNELIKLSNDETEHIYANVFLALIFGETRYFKANISTEENSIKLILGGKYSTLEKGLTTGNIAIYKDKIIGTTQDLPEYLPTDIKNIIYIGAQDKLITPGLIEQHIHGGYGVNFNTADEDEMISFLQKMPSHGITSILPTIMTDSIEKIRKQIEKIYNIYNKNPKNICKIQGIHLEGPFLSSYYKGIHEEKLIKTPLVDSFKEVDHPLIKLVTYAPEDDKDFEFTKYLINKGITPSAGHSGASAEVLEEGANTGIKQVTHLFNAMTPIHHRKPGIIAESLINDNIYTEIIPDGLHLHPKIIKLILKSKPENKVIFISDSLPINRYGGNSIIFGGQEIFNKEGKAVNNEGTFAGSMLFLDDIFRFTDRLNIAPKHQLIGFMTENPAKNLGINTGKIQTGLSADLVIWDENTLNVEKTIINGKIVFETN